MEEKETNSASAEKIQALRDMILNAEKTLQGAKAMLLQLEGKKKTGRKRKISSASEDDKIIEGTFDGQLMIGADGKQYPVPANYASKSKLVEGDMLKLTITLDGSFIYKQIGPAERKRLIGLVNQDADGNYFITAEGKPYRVLLASITYFKVEPGDEVTLITSRDIESDWGSIENVIQSARDKDGETKKKKRKSIEEEIADIPTGENSAVDEWAPDFEELKRELNKPEA
ncbi:MAG: hypothetical protein NTZ97_00045 [Candidatus Moranbacteria bacterium]|nr:hypothetical protein [Candidatus Moranbacteria bacterium]